jgi:D-inositol-3-phosphate glycosyltransferase
MPAPGRTLALGYDMRHLGGGLKFSIARFHTDLVRALVRRGAFERLLLVARPFAPRRGNPRPTVEAILRAKPRAMRMDVTDYSTLAATASAGAPPDVLHEGSWQDLVRPFRLRRLYPNGRFPVTVSHHGLAPPSTLKDFGFDLLFCDSRPYDAIVSTSHAALAIVRAHLDHAREGLARASGAAVQFRGRFAVIPLGVDPALYKPRARPPLRRRFGLSEDAVVLLVYGRFTFGAKADLLPLLRVLRYVIDDSPGIDVQLVIAGSEGPPAEEATLRAYAAELGLEGRIKRLSALVVDDDPFLFAAADVFVGPSDGIFENFGLAPVQAMACGVPAVVSDWDGHRDTVVHGETGFLVPTIWGPCDPGLSRRASFLEPGSGIPPLVETTAIDVRALREHLGALVRSREMRREMGRKARDRASVLFTVDGVAARYEELWAELGAVARADRKRLPPWVDVLDAPLQTLYRAQVSVTIGDDTRVAITEAGRRVLDGAEVVPLSGIEPSFVEQPVAWQLLVSLASARGASGRPAGALTRAVGRACARASDAVWGNLMWLMKYGYLERIVGPG